MSYDFTVMGRDGTGWAMSWTGMPRGMEWDGRDGLWPGLGRIRMLGRDGYDRKEDMGLGFIWEEGLDGFVLLCLKGGGAYKQVYDTARVFSAWEGCVFQGHMHTHIHHGLGDWIWYVKMGCPRWGPVTGVVVHPGSVIDLHTRSGGSMELSVPFYFLLLTAAVTILTCSVYLLGSQSGDGVPPRDTELHGRCRAGWCFLVGQPAGSLLVVAGGSRGRSQTPPLRFSPSPISPVPFLKAVITAPWARQRVTREPFGLCDFGARDLIGIFPGFEAREIDKAIRERTHQNNNTPSLTTAHSLAVLLCQHRNTTTNPAANC